MSRFGQVDESSNADRVRKAVAQFGAELVPKMRGDGRREDQLRAPIHSLVRALGKIIIGRQLIVHDEVTLPELRSRPDLAIDTSSGRVGYIELKAPEKGIPGRWLPAATKPDRLQWQKLRNLPNLIYTNGTEWGLYRSGVLRQVAKLDGDLRRAGSALAPENGQLEVLFREFLSWKPASPATFKEVVRDVAPLCRLLRDQVEETMILERHSAGKRPFTTLAAEWRGLLFPSLKDVEFADAYAQAVTFALLLARVDGVSFENRSLGDIAEQLSKQHSLMGEALSILSNHRWIRHLGVVETLKRVVGNIDWANFERRESDVYSALYETFLAEYDPKLRRLSGTYYTPDQVARAMVQLADQILKENMHKRRGFAAADVVVIDPAMGTGTFLVEVMASAVRTLQEERGSPAIPQAHLRELFAKRLVGFENQAAPYAVAELRLHHTLKNLYGVDLPREEVRFLSNAFDDPETLGFDLGLWYEVLKESAKEANRIKIHQPVMVVIGNPPWRENARGSARWLEEPRDRKPGSGDTLQRRPSLDEFRSPSQARRAFNLSNMWTFFWRWATWKVFDAASNEDNPAGIVALITPKAYLTSSSHAGMRRYLRETADDGWVIDVTPEGFRPDVRTRLFPGVQQEICIGIFARYGAPDRSRAARVRYTSISGSQAQKFEQLESLHIGGSGWADCPTGWDDPFRPTSKGWDVHPMLADVFPWQHTGVNSNRNWVWAPDVETLCRRWSTLIHSPPTRKALLFKETDTCSIDKRFANSAGVPAGKGTIRAESGEIPSVVRVAFRSFDRQYLIYDRRVIDRPRPELWDVGGDNQIYISEQHSHSFSRGLPLLFSALVPNVDHFNGRGGRVLPLYRDARATEPNVAPKLTEVLGEILGTAIDPAALLAYIAAVVAHPGYTEMFAEELKSPGIRVPLSADPAVWREAVEIGQEVIWLHTFGERNADPSAGRRRECPLLPKSERPYFIDPIPCAIEDMPETICYDPLAEIITIGGGEGSQSSGRIGRVKPRVWSYTVGGYQVVPHWFSYRKRNPARRKRTSDLDAIHSEVWTAQFDDELLELLNVVGRCVALEPRQAELLESVLARQVVTVADLHRHGVLPVPGIRRRPPRILRDTIPEAGD